MTRLLTRTKANPKKNFLIKDQSNVVKIKQPDIMDAGTVVKTNLFS